MTETSSDGDTSTSRESSGHKPPPRTIGARIARAVLGRAATHCAYCGGEFLEELGYRVVAFQVYCTPEHAILDLENPM